MTKITRFTAALAVAMTIITLAASGAKARQLAWWFHVGTEWSQKPLSEYFEDQGMSLNAGNTHVFLVLGLFDKGAAFNSSGQYDDFYIGDPFMNDLARGAFDPSKVTTFYSGTDYEMSKRYEIKSPSLGPGTTVFFPSDPADHVVLTFLVISVNEGVLGEAGCQYDYYYTQRNTFVRPDSYSAGGLSSQNVSGAIWSGSSIPEPATGLLAITGAALLLLRRKRRITE